MQKWSWALIASLGACAGAAPPEAARPSPSPQLTVVSATARAGATPQALGLSGRNKPNGTEYRYRVSVPENTPAFVLRRIGTLDLTIADFTRDGWVALYRSPAELGPNSEFRAVLYAFDGAVRWTLPLNPLLSRTTQLEVQDIRYGESGELYLNEACQTYAREADGQCSALLRVDPVNARVVWRTRPLVSNNILLPHGDVVIAGYGFTAEPDSLYLIDAATGEERAALGLDSAHEYLELHGGLLYVLTTNRVYRLRLAAAGSGQ